MSDSWDDTEQDADARTGTGDQETRAVLVRPKGFVEPFPVVRRISGRDLYLGNESAADPDPHDRKFDFVLSLTAETQPATTHHRPLVDGPGTDWASFAAAVDTARRLYREDGSLLVHCTAGISRSSAVLATMLAAEEGQRFRDALALIQQARPVAMPHPALHELAVVYLAADGD